MRQQAARPRHPEGLWTTDQAAAELRVPAALIRKWRHSGKAMPSGVLRAAAPGGYVLLWRLDELRDLATRYHQTRRRRHDRQRP